MKHLARHAIAIAIVLVGPHVDAGAQELVGLTATQTNVPLHDMAEFVLQVKPRGNDLIWCGVTVDFGDGEKREVRVEMTTWKIVKQYQKAGRYTVSVDGTGLFRGLRSALACLGPIQSAVVNVVAPDAVAVGRPAAVPAAPQASGKTERERELERELKELRDQARKPPPREPADPPGPRKKSPAASDPLPGPDRKVVSETPPPKRPPKKDKEKDKDSSLTLIK